MLSSSSKTSSVLSCGALLISMLAVSTHAQLNMPCTPGVGVGCEAAGLAVPITTTTSPGVASFSILATAADYIDDICLQVGVTHENLNELEIKLDFISIQEGTTSMEMINNPANQLDELSGAAGMEVTFSRYPTDTSAVSIGIKDQELFISGKFFATALNNVIGDLNAGTWRLTVTDTTNAAENGVLEIFNLYFNGEAERVCMQSMAPSSAPSSAPSMAPSASPTEQSPVGTPSTWLLIAGLTLTPFVAYATLAVAQPLLE